MTVLLIVLALSVTLNVGLAVKLFSSRPAVTLAEPPKQPDTVPMARALDMQRTWQERRVPTNDPTARHRAER